MTNLLSAGGPCPSCGRCPTCGQFQFNFRPYYFQEFVTGGFTVTTTPPQEAGFGFGSAPTHDERDLLPSEGWAPPSDPEFIQGC